LRFLAAGEQDESMPTLGGKYTRGKSGEYPGRASPFAVETGN
jgi:hypothetical protein